jgi:drug/metabolite transporter (DMT)-like permease
MRQGQSRRGGLGLAIVSALAFSTSGSLARSLIGAGWSPAAAVLARVSIAAVVLAVPAWASMRGRWRALRSASGIVTVYGLAAVAGAQLCYFNAVQHLSVGVALMLEYLGIVLVVGWMWIRHGHRPRRLTLYGSAVALVGLVLVLGVIGSGHLDLVGVIWGLGAAFGLATYFVLASRGDDDLPPVALASMGMGVGALALLGLGGVGVLPMHATFGAVAFAGHHVSWLVPVACLSLVAAALGYLAGITAARMLGARLSSFVGLIEVVFAVLVAWLLLGELPAPLQLAGGALIIAGIALVRLDELRRPDDPLIALAAPAPAAALAAAGSAAPQPGSTSIPA